MPARGVCTVRSMSTRAKRRVRKTSHGSHGDPQDRMGVRFACRKRYRVKCMQWARIRSSRSAGSRGASDSTGPPRRGARRAGPVVTAQARIPQGADVLRRRGGTSPAHAEGKEAVAEGRGALKVAGRHGNSRSPSTRLFPPRERGGNRVIFQPTALAPANHPR